MLFNVILWIFVMCMMCRRDSRAERRITNGKPVQEYKRYVVYLIKAPSSPQKYDAWLCGGAIVSPLYIVTSAACIEDVQHMYAIAGYNKYVQYESLDANDCTKTHKKKVVYTCVPKAYDFNYENVEKWAHIDIGVVKVESPYDFSDKSYENHCTHVPNAIPVNYEAKYQEPGTDAMVLGWGHSEIWRKPSDNTDYNQEKLHYAATLIEDKEKCKKSYEHMPKMDVIIDRYMICTNDAGNINDVGELIQKKKPVANGCVDPGNQSGSNVGLMDCDDTDDTNNGLRVDDSRREFNINDNVTRRHGICQNDHGGPLVTWVGSHEILIGVASVFRVTTDSKCEGPYLFTSTQCNGAFLDCVINRESSTRRSSICDKPPEERGFRMEQRQISWMNHPDGPADNEKVRLRPLLPIRTA